MSEYQPELGQAIFGQPHQQYEVPEFVEAALAMLDREMERVWCNAHQMNERYSSPFSNTGGRYEETPVFSVHAYDWSENEQQWNFRWGDIQISWYKYLGRGMSANVGITPDIAAAMLKECLEAVRALEAPDDAR